MAKNFKEIGKKTEQLIEQGSEADKEVERCQNAVVSASNAVATARRQLAVASKTDEEGNPAGNVEYAMAQLHVAESMLVASQRLLSMAVSDSERIKQQKRAHISEIEKHNQVEKANMEKLSKLREEAFGSDSVALSDGMARRLNEAEDSRVALLRSMGIDASPEYVSLDGDNGEYNPWEIGGFAAIDTQGSVLHYKGGSAQNISVGNGGYNTILTGRNNVTINGDDSGLNSAERIINNSGKSLFGRLFGKEKKQQNEIIDFNGLELERNGLFGERFLVKGNHYSEYCDFRRNYDDYKDTYEHMIVNQIKIVNARDIEGILLNENEAHDRHLFWNRDKEHKIESELYFLEVASHIPEVRMRLANGENVESVRNNTRLTTCYDYYFDSPIKVDEIDGYYYFTEYGRHRCMAAQKLGYDIPVNVVGKYNKKSAINLEITQINTHESLSQYMNTKYDIYLDMSISQLNLETVKGALSGVEAVIKEYPDVGNLLKSGIISDLGVMSCTGSKLLFNPDYFSDNQRLRTICNDMSNRGFWVANASTESIGVHEAAHGVEWALIQANNKQYFTETQKEDAWKKCTEATNIVRKACDNIKKTEYGVGKSSTELVRSISTYALQSDSETMAEAFADVFANGEKANPLSKEIKYITKEVMNKYKGE